MNSLTTGEAMLRRLKADYLIRSHRREYDSFLREARKSGYALLSLSECYDLLKNGTHLPPDRCVALRHDVDVGNVAGNESFHQVEASHGAHATYYFRLSTARSHVRLIKRLLEDGFEVGYHFEEGATLAKRRRLSSREAVFECRDEITSMFRDNAQAFRKLYNTQLRSVCSHGDWINRELGFTNNEFVNDDILTECGLSFEAYQVAFKSPFDVYVSDVVTSPERFSHVLTHRQQLVYALAHERQWYPGPVANTAANFVRAWEGLRYRLGGRTRCGC